MDTMDTPFNARFLLLKSSCFFLFKKISSWKSTHQFSAKGNPVFKEKNTTTMGNQDVFTNKHLNGIPCFWSERPKFLLNGAPVPAPPWPCQRRADPERSPGWAPQRWWWWPRSRAKNDPHAWRIYRRWPGDLIKVIKWIICFVVINHY